jgi:glycerol uptake facilitator-like aquaporin
MFGKPLFSIATKMRPGIGPVLGELVATAGLILVIRGSSRFGIPAAAVAVGCYITAAYWFTSSTAFANPAVTLARAASDTFAGIRPRDVPGFLFAQVVGGVAAVALADGASPSSRNRADDERKRNG